jgi:predicted CxxxxCH...CXXCH cytochrome family protein
MATTLLPNGGHFTHASNSVGPKLDCSSCHTGYTATTTNGTTHANKVVEISSTSGYTKTQPIAAGTAWGTCSNGNCHGQATGLVWGGSIGYKVGNDNCSTCHSSTTGVTAGTPFYSTKYPGQTISPSDAKVGAHTYHMLNSNMMSRAFVCSDCHGPVALNDANHMNGATNFSWSSFTIFSSSLTKKVLPSYSAGTCSNYCHGSKMPYGDTTGTRRNPSWGSPFMPTTLTLPASCNGCHGFPPSSASGHPASAASLVACKTCHPNVNSAATGYADVFVNKALHIDGILQGGGCNGCHGYPPSNKRFTGSAGNWADARMENYTGGGGAHTIVAHISPMATQDQAWANCTNCHNQSDHVTSPAVFNPSSNIKVTVDPKFKFATDRTAKYNSNKLDGNLHIPGNCSNVSCHFQKTPQW